MFACQSCCAIKTAHAHASNQDGSSQQHVPCIGWHKREAAAALCALSHMATWLTMCIPCGQADISRIVAARQLAGDIYNRGVSRGDPLGRTRPPPYVPAQSSLYCKPDIALDQLQKAGHGNHLWHVWTDLSACELTFCKRNPSEYPVATHEGINVPPLG